MELTIPEDSKRTAEGFGEGATISTTTESAELLLQRDQSSQLVTFGKLYLSGKYLCETLELPWKDNVRKISCVPVGRYRVVQRHSPKFGQHYHLLDVPGRSLILFHTGNTAKDIEGCILVGQKRGQLGGAEAVLFSKVAMTALKAVLDPLFTAGREVWVTISIDET